MFPDFIDTFRFMYQDRNSRSLVAFGVLMVALLVSTEAYARELPRSGDWRAFENAEACWAATQIKGTSQIRTGGKVYASARLARGAREPKISLTIGRSFPKGLAVALVVDGKNIPLFVSPPQTAFPKDNMMALQALQTGTQALYVSEDKGYGISLDGFSDALSTIKAACN